MQTSCGAMVEKTPQRYARRMAKGIWWLATPWRMPQRMQVLRDRADSEARALEMAELTAREQARVAPDWRAAAAPAETLDLFDDAAVARAADVPWELISWPPEDPRSITDRWSAARFCIGLWRRRSALRAQFPTAFSGGSKGEFGLWLRQTGAAQLQLSDAAVEHLFDALDAGLADRARQLFLAHDVIPAVLPHGLTPVGMPDLFRWFARHGMNESDLRVEELWWLFLEAAQNPGRELTRAHAFAPAWQRLHPDGLTVFGRDAFAAWFASAYGAVGPWLDPATWPDVQEPAIQIRTSYWVRDAWRAAHPDALADECSARAFLDWLASPAAALPEPAREWCRRLDPQWMGTELARSGANVIGHFCYPSGLRVSAESMVLAMRSAGVSTSLRDVHTDARDEPRHVQYRGMECNDITIIHAQPEPFFDDAYGRAHLFERSPRTYRIAYWYWEFDSIPEAWVAHAKNVDEVWTATEFVARGLRERLAVPVRVLFPGVSLARFERRERAHFGLSDAPFTFLFTFHMMSVMERKNPLGLIRAFRQAFGDDPGVRLVLKTSFGDRHPVQMQELRDAAAGIANISVIEALYSPDEVLSLMDACDAYVSLHRSEGLGLTMAEAMLMGKPVIATNFSGNVDFMDAHNSLPVSHELVTLQETIPPYDAGLRWAEPSLDHAAELMRRVYENQAWAREVGARGKASAEARLSPGVAGRKIAQRLAEIRRAREARTRGS
jgi:glycosyltransferase involved in cell wall biosynthesis